MALAAHCFFLVLSSSSFAGSFSAVQTSCRCEPFRYDHQLRSVKHGDCNCKDRRSFLKNSTHSIGLGSLASAGLAPANAVVNESPTVAPAPFFISAHDLTGNFDCLLDLPSITPGCVRLYLCRHGQTENNRLNLVQGARVDPPINDTGYEQSRRLGIAVSRLMVSKIYRTAAPRLVAHSALVRARETAEVLISTASSQSNFLGKYKMKQYGSLPSLGEVDFGSLDGIDVKYFRKVMRNTFASWSLGNIDRQTGAGGESGREVLERAVLSMEELSELARTSSSSSILAVSHSVFIRIFTSLVSDTPLAEAAFRKIRNGSVSVIDINVEGKRRLVTSKSGLFGGEVVSKLKGDNGLRLGMPEAHLIRRNEVRHLEGMDV